VSARKIKRSLRVHRWRLFHSDVLMDEGMCQRRRIFP